MPRVGESEGTDMRRRASGGTDDPGIQAAAERAVELIGDGARVGLGSGRAATAFIAKLGLRRLNEGLRVTGIPTSAASADAARLAGIPLIELAEGVQLDITVDGADEVLAAATLDLVKGWGGALVRERIVAAASKRQVILVGEEKLVRGLGQRGRVPVEVIPFAQRFVTGQLRALGLVATPRMNSAGTQPFVSENGNVTLDCALSEAMREGGAASEPARRPLDGQAARETERALLDGQAARALERSVLAIPGVVDTGLFLGTAELVLVGHADGRVDAIGRKETDAPGAQVPRP